LRKLISFIAFLSLFAVAYAQGPKMGKNGGVGSASSTFSSGEPTGGTYSINGTTGVATFPRVNLPASSPTPTNGDLWTTSSALSARINGQTITMGPGVNSVTYAKDQGVKCDGTTDDTAALNAAFAALPSNRVLVLPQGICIYTSALTWNAKNYSEVRGSGRGPTELRYTGSSTSITLFTLQGLANVTQGFNISFGDLKFSSTTTMTAGDALLVQFCRFCRIHNIEMTGVTNDAATMWDGIYIQNPDFINLTHFIIATKNKCLKLSGRGVGTTHQYDVWANNGKIGGCQVGINVGGGLDNIHFDAIMDTSNNRNVVIDNSLSAFKNQEISFGPRMITDQPVNENYYINDTLTDQTNYCSFRIGGIISAAGQSGILINNAPNCFVSIDAQQIVKSGTTGVAIIDASTWVSISPLTQIANNTQYGVAAAFSYSRLLWPGSVHDNTLGNFNSNIAVIGPNLPRFGNGIDAANYKVGGVAGVTCNAAPTASWRSVNGIVTAC
jgi:hypothetical protein